MAFVAQEAGRRIASDKPRESDGSRPADCFRRQSDGHPDGDANDTRFVGDLVPIVRSLVAGLRLWIVDSGFCDLTQTAHFTSESGDEFIVRYHPKVRFVCDPDRPWGWLRSDVTCGGLR